MNDNNLVAKSALVHPQGIKGICEMVNAELNTNYPITNFYGYKSGYKKTPKTIKRVLRIYLIRNSFDQKIAEKIIDTLY